MAPEPAKRSDSETFLEECEALEGELAALKVAYEQYFLGAERQPPVKLHNDFKKKVLKLKGKTVRSTLLKFRAQSLQSKVMTYERLWSRTIQEIEAGTYRRDVFKARRRAEVRGRPGPPQPGAAAARPEPEFEDIPTDFDVDEEPEAPPPPPPPRAPVVAPPRIPTVAPAVPRVAAPPLIRPVSPAIPPVAPAVPRVAPLAAAARPAPVAAGGLSEDRLKAVYDAYVSAKRSNREDTSKMSFETVAASLRRQVPELMKQHKATSVDFKVVIKDGKTILKAVPK